jgi:hypothetical protein
MRDTNDLRHAFEAATAGLTVHLPPELIRRRARGVRARQAATITAAAVVAATALAVPAVVLAGGPGPASEAAGQVPGASACPIPSPSGPGQAEQWLGPLVETGATFDVPQRDTRYDVLLGLTGTREYPAFVIAFRDRRTGTVRLVEISGFSRDPNGDFAGKEAGDPSHQFQSSQLVLGPDSVLDVGLYSRAAHRITVTSGGHVADAGTARNAATGWTFFWVQRAAAPQPRVTLTAYDAAGRVQATVTGGPDVGLNVQNARDHLPSSGAAPSATGTTPASACPTR